jgi:hypothetical protein
MSPFEVLAIGTFWFWVLIAAEMLTLVLLVENEQSAWATISVICTLIALQIFGGVPVWQFILHNPLVIVLFLAIYCLLGTGWCVAKWWLYVKDQLYRYNDAKRDYLENHRITGDQIPQDKWNDFMAHMGSYTKYGTIVLRPKVREHKSMVYLWMAYWPWSFVFTILNDPVRKIYRHIYQSIHTYLQRISDHVWAGVQLPPDVR